MAQNRAVERQNDVLLPYMAIYLKEKRKFAEPKLFSLLKRIWNNL